MKKMFMTAIALVVFSVVSMANTNETKVVTKLTVQDTKVESKTPESCIAMVVAALSVMEDEYGCMSSATYNYYYGYGAGQCSTK